MLGVLSTRHRLALAGALTALVVGVVLSGAQAGGDVAVTDGGGRTGSALVLESSPVAAVAVVGRARGSVEAELFSVVRLVTSFVLAFGVVSLAGLAPRSGSWWHRAGTERRTASPLRGWTRAALRAPPAAG